MKDFIAFFAFIGLMLFGAHKLEQHTCYVKAESFEDVKYNFIGGCRVKHGGRWLPLENIRGFD